MGWRVNTDLQALSVYTLRSGVPEELIRGTNYVRYAVNDLNQDDLWELVVFRADAEGNGMADYYCWEDGALQLRTSARITSTMAELSQQGRVKSGTLADNSPALFVTGVEESAWMATDILTVKNGELVNILLSDVTGVSSEVAPLLLPVSGGHQRGQHPPRCPARWRNTAGTAKRMTRLADRLVRVCRRRHGDTGAADLSQCGGRMVPAPAGDLGRPGGRRAVHRNGRERGDLFLPGK